MGLETLWRDEPIYLMMAVVGTTLFLLRFILMLVGGGGLHDAPGHLDLSQGESGAHADSDVSLKLLTVQSVTAFLMAAGWAGLALRLESGVSSGWALLLALAIGAAVAALFSYLIFRMRGLNRQGNFDIEAAAGSPARVYRAIPAKGSGEGEVVISVSGRQRTVRAVSAGRAIPSFANVRVVSVHKDEELLVVESESAGSPEGGEK